MQTRPLLLGLLGRSQFNLGLVIAANPYCEKIIGLTNGLRPKLLKKDSDISLEKVFINLKKSYGSTVHTLIKCGYTPAQIFHRIDTGKVSSRMVNAGILSEHRADPLFVPF